MNPLYAQWTQIPYFNKYNSIVGFASKDTNLFAADYSGVYLSTDNGNTWNKTGLTNSEITSLAISGSDLYVGTESGVLLSTNQGTDWQSITNSLPNLNVTYLAIKGSYIFAGTQGSGMLLSTDGGAHWDSVNTGFSSSYKYGWISDIIFNNSSIFVSIYSYGVYYSTNNGTNWIAINTGLTHSSVSSIAISDTNIIAGVYWNDGAYISSIKDNNWFPITDFKNRTVKCFKVSPNNPNCVFAGTDSGFVFLSINSGKNWSLVNSGLTTTEQINTLIIKDNILFAGTSGGMWQRPLSEMITSVENTLNEIPQCLYLSQNYPNPFNPSTTISFYLPSRSFVSLKIFDLIGREVVTLVSEEMSAGNYIKQWNANNLAGGIYFYRLQAGSFIISKKLVFLK